MHFYILRGRTIFWGILFLLTVVVISCMKNSSQSVFRVGDREIPIYSVEREDNKVALTFNCAWNDSDIDSILKTLSDYHVKATFFAVGDWAEKYPDAVKKIDAAGHELGNHSYRHAHYSKMSREEILEDMQKCDTVLENLTGKKPYLFRAAYGEYNNTVVSACDESGRQYIQWSLDSLDYKAKSPEKILNRLDQKVRPGEIILMHNGTECTKDALPKLLETLTKDFTLCTVSELIYHENYLIDHAGVQKRCDK